MQKDLLQRQKSDLPGSWYKKYFRYLRPYIVRIKAFWIKICMCSSHWSMQRIYRIFRNNKEMGPFGLEELEHLSLSPSDLIWVDGQSAGWRYPSEITTLKYNPAKTVVKSPEAKISQGPEAVSGQRSAALNNNAPEAKNTFAQEPEPEEWNERKLEQKANELYQRVAAFTQSKNNQKESSQTKYARSLDDLKQEYADWLDRKKHKQLRTTTARNLLVLSVVILLTGAGFLLIYKNYHKTIVLPTAVGSVSAISNKVTTANFQNPQRSSSIQTDKPQAAVYKSTVGNAIQDDGVDQFIDSVEHVLSKNNVSLNRNLKRAMKTKNQKNIHLYSTQVPSIQVEKIPRTDMPLSQFVNMNAKYMYDANEHFFGIEITLQNKSNQLLKKATVDVLYYRNKQHLIGKETLLFSNIHPGTSFTLSTPGNKKAQFAKFQLGELTGEAAN